MRRSSQGQNQKGVAVDAEQQCLLQRVTQRDEAAFDALYAHYAPLVRHYLSRRLDRQDLIDETIQEVMLVLWQQAAKVRQKSRLGAWLCGVARFKLYQAVANASPVSMTQDADAPPDGETPEMAFLRQEDRAVLARELNALPHGERTTMSLLFQGSSYQEIAAATGDPVSTVRTRVSRACRRLKTRITTLESRP